MFLDDSAVINIDFPGLRTFAASTTSVASMTSTATFYQKNYGSWFLAPKWSKNQSLFEEWIIKNPIFYWCLIPFLLQAVEARRCYFFENWLIKLKWPSKATRHHDSTKYWSFYPSEPFSFVHFNMLHPVCYVESFHNSLELSRIKFKTL